MGSILDSVNISIKEQTKACIEKKNDKKALEVEKFILETLKYIKSELLANGLRVKGGNQKSEANVILDLADQREKTIKTCKEQGRGDLVEKEEKELAIIKRFVPEGASEEDVQSATECEIEALRASYGPNYAITIKDLKTVISAVREKLPTAEGGMIKKIFEKSIKNS